jgi:hypothetical protein
MTTCRPEIPAGAGAPGHPGSVGYAAALALGHSNPGVTPQEAAWISDRFSSW